MDRYPPPMAGRPPTAQDISKPPYNISPSDTADQAAALQTALGKAKPGAWLVFPPGQYRHSKALRLDVPDVTVDGRGGAILVSTNPDESAIAIQKDYVKVYGFRRWSKTTVRKQATLCASICVNAPLNGPLVNGFEIRGNIIEDHGTEFPMSSPATGILIHHGSGLIEGNSLRKTWADSIHMTQGTQDMVVIWNRVQFSGDDEIAVVSYAGTPTDTPAVIAAEMQQRRSERLVRRVYAAHNTLSDQWHGRGMTIVGGEDITYEFNTIDRSTHAAAGLVAREQGYRTFGVRNVLFRFNRITEVQTTAPGFVPAGKTPEPNTGHGALEANTLVTQEEIDAGLLDDYAIRDVLFLENTVRRCKFVGARLNPRNSKGIIQRVGYVRNEFVDVADPPIAVQVPWTTIYAEGNLNDGLACIQHQSAWECPEPTGAGD